MAAAYPALVLAPGNAVFPHMNLALAFYPPPVPQVNVHRWGSLCVGPLKGCLLFQCSSVLLRWQKSSLIFTVRGFKNSSSLSCDPWLGSPQMRWDVSPSGEPLQTYSVSRFPSSLAGVGPVWFMILPLLLTSMWLFLCYQMHLLWSAGLQVIPYINYFIIW